MKRLVFFLESRATIGYVRPVIECAAKNKELILDLIVTGSHLEPEFGGEFTSLSSWEGIPIKHKIESYIDVGSTEEYAESLGHSMAGFAAALKDLAPDIVIVAGDRSETFMMVTACVYARVPCAHIQAGDKSGHVDDVARYAIAKLANLHFAANSECVDRLIKLGEPRWRIFDTGAPQLDDLKYITDDIYDNQNWAERVFRTEPYIVVVLHPLADEALQPVEQVKTILSVLEEKNRKIIWVYPNVDFGHREIIEALEDALKKNPCLVLVPNLDRSEFLSLLKNASLLVGNSSCGILEAPSFKIPVINIGARQRGRMRAANIVDIGWSAVELFDAVRKCETKQFIDQLYTVDNPHGDGFSASRIVDVLTRDWSKSELLDKESTY